MRRLLLSGAVVIALAVIAPRIPGAGTAAVRAQDAACAGVAAPFGGTATPSNCVASGSQITIRVERFAAGQLVSVFITGVSGAGETGKVGGGDRSMRVGGNGVLAIEIDTSGYEGVALRAGDHVLFAKPVGAPEPPARVPFRVVGAAGAPVGVTAAATARPGLTATRGATSPLPTATGQARPSPTRSSGVGGTPTTTGAIASPTTAGRQPPATTTATRATPSDEPVEAQACGAGFSAVDAPDYPVVIDFVDKVNETVTLLNISPDPVDLTGWRMCSVVGNQDHPEISGVLPPDESLTFGNAGRPIWNDNTEDDGALYDADGDLISFWDD